ncbi:MAG: phosphopantetheine-binding protein [Pseudomonadota bacterium]
MNNPTGAQPQQLAGVDATIARVRTLVAGLCAEKKETVTEDSELLLSGLLDSLDVVNVAAEIETGLGTEIAPIDLTIENFETLPAIEAFVRRLAAN